MRIELFLIAWALAIALFALYIATGWFRDARAAIVARQEARVLEVLSVLLFENDAEAEKVHAEASKLPTGPLLAVVQTLAVDLDGQARGRLQSLVRINGLEKSIRRRVRSRRWRIRGQAAQLQYLVTHPDHDRSVLLRDKHPLVRARAAESLTANQAAEQVDELMDLLEDDAIVVRMAAQDAVLQAGARAVPALLDRLQLGKANALQALQVAANLPDARLTNALDDYAHSTDVDRRRLAAEALSHGGGEATAQILERLAVDEEESVRIAAIDSLAVIRSYRSAAVVGRALADRAWPVRRAAGLALDELGAPGHMLLRRHLRDDDPFARDMARQMLDSIAARTGLTIIPALDNPLDLVDADLLDDSLGPFVASTTQVAAPGEAAPIDDLVADDMVGEGELDAEVHHVHDDAGENDTRDEPLVAVAASSADDGTADSSDRPVIRVPRSSTAVLDDPARREPVIVRAASRGQAASREEQAAGERATSGPDVPLDASVALAPWTTAPTEPGEVDFDLRLDDDFLEALLGPAPQDQTAKESDE